MGYIAGNVWVMGKRCALIYAMHYGHLQFTVISFTKICVLFNTELFRLSFANL